jgi:hypothetical protein
LLREPRMVDAQEPRFASETELLLDVVARYSGPSVPTDVEVYDALERGFARLMFLEAQLRDRSVGGGDAASVTSGEQDELQRRIECLRSALSALRSRTLSEHTSPLALGGFVLPSVI